MKHSNNNEKYFFEIYNYKDEFPCIDEDQFYFILKDKEGNSYLESLPYIQKTKCQKDLKSVIRNSKNGVRFGAKRFPYGLYNVYLKDGNDEIIAVSEDFDTKEEARNFIIKLKHISHLATVIDKTK